jgi:N-acetylglucosaminyldiphosphoundecaprenol N-acetyl-beta-D-mannosaminyltransferase
MNTKKVNLFGTAIDCLTLEETIALVEEIVEERTPRQHVVVNALKIAMMNSDPKIREIVNSCDIINADGLPVVWASRLLKKPLPERVAGVDLFLKLVERCAMRGYRPYFLGATSDVLEKTVAAFMCLYPQLLIAGFRNGYFSEADETKVAEAVRDSRADMLFVGISSPKKERFLNRYINTMQVPFCMGVGGSFDIVAGKTRRAPSWMQTSGLEWLHRVLEEPRRMWWRYTKTNSIFIWMVLQEYLRGGRGHRSCSK